MRSSNDVSLLNTMATAMNCQLNMNYFENSQIPVQMPNYNYQPVNYPVLGNYNSMYPSQYGMMPLGNIDNYNVNQYDTNFQTYQYSDIGNYHQSDNFVKEIIENKGIRY